MEPRETVHVPVLASEILEWLDPQAGQTIVDGTLGGGGHTRLLAERVGSGGHIIALDRDTTAIECAAEALRGLPITLVHARFDELPVVLDQLQISPVAAVLLDIGLSSDQLADASRGFSFTADGPLDLRFDTTTGEPAWRLLDRVDAGQLADIIYQLGEERFSRQIARRIVERRRENPIRTAAELAELIRSCVPRGRDQHLDPATRTFQALRIAVNDELGCLERALANLPDCLRPGGRLAVISFHSLEDRRVKTAFRDDSRYLTLTKKPIRPNESEAQRNPRSRSARLRVAERR